MSRCIHNCVNFARTIRNNAKLFANSNQLRISQFSLRKQSRGRFNGLFSEISEFGMSRKREKKNEKPGARWTSRCVVDVEPGVGYQQQYEMHNLNFVQCASARTFYCCWWIAVYCFRWLLGCQVRRNVVSHLTLNQWVNEWMNDTQNHARALQIQTMTIWSCKNRTVHICIEQPTCALFMAQNEWDRWRCLPHTD